MSNVRITVSIDPKLKEQLDTYASQEGLDRSAAFEQILRSHFERPKQETPPPRRPHPQNPEPLPPDPQPYQPHPQLPQNPPPIGIPKDLERRLEDLERNYEMTRQYLNLVYPMNREILVRNAAYYTYIYGSYLEVGVYPPPPWWDGTNI